MNKHGYLASSPSKKVIISPAYPFSARDLLNDLRSRISIVERSTLSFARLGRLIGQATSTTHHWFAIHPQPHLLALMTLLERLPKPERHAYIDAYCRIFPTIEDPRLAHDPAQVIKLSDLLRRKTGLTVVAGSEHSFIATALGHAYSRFDKKHRGVAGIEVCRPDTFVPVEGMYYVDPIMGAKLVRGLVAELLPKVITSHADLLIFDGVWSIAPESRVGLIRCSGHKHVIVAERKAPQLSELKASKSVTLLRVSGAKSISSGTKLDCALPLRPN